MKTCADINNVKNPQFICGFLSYCSFVFVCLLSCLASLPPLLAGLGTRLPGLYAGLHTVEANEVQNPER